MSTSGRPMFPAASARRPATRSRCATSAVVVVLPLVPVIAIKRVPVPAKAWKPRSISERIGTRASRAAASGGASGGTPGETITAAASRICARSWRPTSSATPRSVRSVSSASPPYGWSDASLAYTRTPSRASSRVAATPLFPSPMTATTPPPAPATPRGSSHLQRRERDRRAHHPQDVEPHHDLRLRPTQFLEVVVQRRHAKHPVGVGVLLAVPPLAPAVHPHLQQHRHRFGDEHAARDEQQKLRLEHDGHAAERPPDGERPGVPHEHLRRVRVKPQEPQRRARQRAAEDRQLLGAWEEVH